MSDKTVEELAAELERLRAERANDATAAREDMAVEVERLRSDRADDATVARVDEAAEIERIRSERAAEAERIRESRADDDAQTREDLAAKLAFEKGAVAARLEARLVNHEEHLARINGSIERSARATQEQTVAIVDLRTDVGKQFDALTSASKDAEKETLKSAAADKADRRKQLFTLLTVTITTAGGIIGTLLATGPS